MAAAINAEKMKIARWSGLCIDNKYKFKQTKNINNNNKKTTQKENNSKRNTKIHTQKHKQAATKKAHIEH